MTPPPPPPSPSPQKEQFDTLQDIQKSCTAALDILNDLLCFNKIESGVLELHKEQVNVVGFVRESVALFNMQVNKWQHHQHARPTVTLTCHLTLRISLELFFVVFLHVFVCYQARDCGVQLQVLFQPFDGHIWSGSGSVHSARSRNTRSRRLSNLARTASVALRGAIQAPALVSGRGSGLFKSVSLSSRKHTGTRWPVAPASEPPIDQGDVTTLDRFKIEQVGWSRVM